MFVAKASEMRDLDRAAIREMQIPGIVLMENAGRGTVQAMINHFGGVVNAAVPVFIGPGNNGGDGLVIARAVHELGGSPLIYFLVSPDALQGDARINCEIVARMGLPCSRLDQSCTSADIVAKVRADSASQKVRCQVDAIFGTGLQRELTGIFREAVLAINQLRSGEGWPTVCVDVPSGLNSDTGEVHGVAVHADLTATYGLPKPVHYLNGSGSAGILKVLPIGIPQQVIEEAGLAGSLIDQSLEWFLQPKPSTAHKGTNGHLLVLAGSAGKTGAAILCAQGALHSGIGLVTMAVPGDLNQIFESTLAEAMSVPLPASRRHLGADDHAIILELLQGKDACVLGPGIGTDAETRDLVLRLYREVSQPMIVDADALNLLAASPDIIAQPGGPRILTPHPGEMARLTGRSTREIQQDRIKAACWKCGTDCAHPIITVLKGAGTIVADATGRWALNTTGNPGMATGGMGDVLAGLIASLAAQGFSPWRSACLGVYLHGLAADRLSRERPVGFLASEVAAEISRVFGTIVPAKQEEKPC